MSKSKSTMVELVTELEKLPQTSEINYMIKEAKAGEFHDYKNSKYVCGKVEASIRLRQLGHPELAVRIEQGEFDEEADADDEAMMIADIDANSSSPELAAAIKKALGFTS